MSRALWPLAVLVLIATIVAGCGSTPAGTGTGNGVAALREKAAKFAQCMRVNGVTGFPDPSASGSYTIDAVVNGSSLDPNSPAFKRAINACRTLEPSGFTGPKVTPQQLTARLKFARCVRDNGVPDFPDPTLNGPLVDTNRIPSSSTSDGMTALNAAMRKCGALYSGQLGVKGP